MAVPKTHLLGADDYQRLVGVRELVALIAAVEGEQDGPVSVFYEKAGEGSWDDIVTRGHAAGRVTHYQVKRTSGTFEERDFGIDPPKDEKNPLRLALVDAKRLWTPDSRFVLGVWGLAEVEFHNKAHRKKGKTDRLQLMHLHDVCESARNLNVPPNSEEGGKRELWRTKVQALLGSDCNAVLAAFAIETLGTEEQVCRSAIQQLNAWYQDGAAVFAKLCLWFRAKTHAKAEYRYPTLHDEILRHEPRRDTVRPRLIVVCSSAHKEIHVGGTMGSRDAASRTWQAPAVVLQLVGGPAYAGQAAIAILRMAVHAPQSAVRSSEGAAWLKLLATAGLGCGSGDGSDGVMQSTNWVGIRPPEGTHWTNGPADLSEDWSNGMTEWVWSQIVSHVDQAMESPNEIVIWRRWRAQFDAMPTSDREQALGTLLSAHWERGNPDFRREIRVGLRSLAHLQLAFVMAVQVADALEHGDALAEWEATNGAISIGGVVVGNVVGTELASELGAPSRRVLIQSVVAEAANNLPLLIWTAVDARTNTPFSVPARATRALTSTARGCELLVRDERWLAATTRDARKAYLRELIEPLSLTEESARRLDLELRQ